MESKITNDNLVFQVEVSYYIFLFEVSTAITLFFPPEKTTRFMLNSIVS